MRRVALAAGLLTLLAGLVLVVRPFVAAHRDYPAEVVSPAALRGTASVPLTPRAPVCFRHAVVDPRSTEARFKIVSPQGPAPALRVRLRGPGYRHVADVPAGAPDGAVIQVPVAPPAEPVPVRVCIESRGRPAIALIASGDRTLSRSRAVVDGERVPLSVWFSFYESTPRTILERLPDTIERMTVFRPGWVVPGVLWVLAAAMVLGVPAGVVWAYARAVREDERAAPPVDVSRRRSWWRRIAG